MPMHAAPHSAAHMPMTSASDGYGASAGQSSISMCLRLAACCLVVASICFVECTVWNHYWRCVWYMGLMHAAPHAAPHMPMTSAWTATAPLQVHCLFLLRDVTRTLP